MRILVVQDSLGTGGAERSNAELWYYLKKKDNDLRIIVLKHRKEGIEQEILQSGFDVIFLPKGHLVKQAREIARIIDDFQPDLVHAVLFKSNLRVRLAKLFTSFSYIESLVCSTYDENRFLDPAVTPLKLKSYQFLDYLTQRFTVDHYHANGETVSRHYQDALRVAPSRLTVIPRGRKENPYQGDPQVYQEVRREFDCGERIIFINVARHEYQKSQDVLLDALAQVKEFREKAILLLVGRDGQLTDQIQARIRDYELGDSVRCLGHRQDVYRLLAGSDVFIFPSRIEGLPGALIEAEAAGLPIICSDIPNNIEVVSQGENAEVFPVNNVEALAGKIRIMLRDKARRKRMGEESLRIYTSNFTIEAINQRMLALFRSLSTGRKMNYSHSKINH